MSERSHPTRLGEVVGGKYRIVRLLAAGGMGAVYEAQHAVVKRRFAVKFLHPELALRRDILARFQREAEAAGALESENVAAAVDFGIAADGTPYIIMEYLVGESLAELLEREGRLPAARAADLVAQACRGIEAAHRAGIVHRDLKPRNLFVCRRQDGTDLVKVLDFGVAKLEALDENTAATHTGAVLGTAAYMAPEQARGDKQIDHRADVYALGAILYELVSGRRPHPGESQNAILYHISTQPVVPLETVDPGLPAALAATATRALAHDPEARFPSAAELADALVAVANRQVWPAPPRGARDDSGAMERPARSPVPSSPTAERRRRWAPLAALALVAVVTATAVALRVRHQAGGAATKAVASSASAQDLHPPAGGLGRPESVRAAEARLVAPAAPPAGPAGISPRRSAILPDGGPSGVACGRSPRRRPGRLDHSPRQDDARPGYVRSAKPVRLIVTG